FKVGLPPHATFAGSVPVAELPPGAFLSPPHADKIAAQVARTSSAAPNLLIFNPIPSIGTMW
ncbi:hypothetical protein, partial [Mycobacterium sp.]|uniref:hypothetical protein n=1 Tax=Mycobacterium sp. TaxID=1785 RepID=UPI003C730D2D